MDKAPSQPQTYVMPAPWGSVRLVTEDGELTAVRPSLEKVSSPSPAPEAVAEVMGLLEEVIATPRATGVETRRRLFALKAFTSLPAFTRRVLEITAAIEPGRTMSYGELAAAAGNPSAARAVGQALAHNPFPILIGCHRVCGASEKKAFDILHPESFKPQAYLGCETLSPVAQWLRLADLSL